MSAGLFYLIAFAVAIALVAVVAVAARLAARSNSLTRAEKAELKALRALITRIDRLAYNQRDIAPELSIQITDEIATFKNKELS